MCAVVRVEGCSATPFGSYLKALGVFRLVSLQADSDARARWDSDTLVLESTLDKEALEHFFLHDYKPTPLVAPWNGGSGFYLKDNLEGIQAIAATASDRFQDYRDVIAVCRAFPEVARGKDKDAKSEEERRTAILLRCRNELPDCAVEWLDAAVGISASGDRAFSPVLGTGGNEGRLDYTNNFMSRIATLLIRPDKKTPVLELLRNSLFQIPAAGLQDGAAGQYDPGRAGGANQGQGIEHKSPTNPWDLVFTLEGAVSWASGLYRRQGISYRLFLCSPFTVRASKVGYGSASSDEKDARAEIWAPLWSGRARFVEIRSLLREGRASIGESPAQDGLEFAQAATSLGVDRSIDRFVRYSLLKRRGDSYVALPAGIFPVGYTGASERTRTVDGIAEQIRRAGMPKDCDALYRRLEQAMYDALLRGHNEPQRVREALAALGRLLRNVATRSDVDLPYHDAPGIEWLVACDSRPEVRIAAALASIYDQDAGAIRWNLQRARPKNPGLASTAGKFAWEGRDLPHRLMSVLGTRLRMYDGRDDREPFAGAVRVHSSDVTPFIEGRVDDDLVEDLVYAFSCFNWSNKQDLPRAQGESVLPAYAAFKLLFFPDKIKPSPESEPERIPTDPRILPLLQAGRFDRATELVSHRLWLAGLTPRDRRYPGVHDPLRLGAALLIPSRDIRDAVAPKTLMASS